MRRFLARIFPRGDAYRIYAGDGGQSGQDRIAGQLVAGFVGRLDPMLFGGWCCGTGIPGAVFSFWWSLSAQMPQGEMDTSGRDETGS